MVNSEDPAEAVKKGEMIFDCEIVALNGERGV